MEHWELRGLFLKSYFAREKMGALIGNGAKTSHSCHPTDTEMAADT